MSGVHGVDVASFQGLPRDWQGEAGDIGWAAVKFTELQPDGTRYADPDATADWAWLAAHGKKRVAYLFGHPATSSAETVRFFLGELARAGGLGDDDMIALDSEENDGRAAAGVAAWGLDVLQMLHRETGRRPLEYTDLSYAEAGNTAGHGEFPLWIADPSSPAGAPRVPGPWKTWAVHQYQAGGKIDRDVANYPDGAAMAAALGKPVPAPVPPPHKQGAPMEFVSQLSLDGPHEIRADRRPVTLKWAKAKGSPLGPEGHAVKIPGGGALLLSLNLHFRNAEDARLELVDASAGTSVAKDWRETGGWCPFTVPFAAKTGDKYEIRVSNYGSLPLVIDRGVWQLLS